MSDASRSLSGGVGVLDCRVNAFGKYCNQFISFIDSLYQAFIRHLLTIQSTQDPKAIVRLPKLFKWKSHFMDEILSRFGGLCFAIHQARRSPGSYHLVAR